VVGCELGNPQPIAAEIESYLHLGIPSAELGLSLRERVRVILLLDVLEHLADPVAFLREHVCNFPACRHFVVTLPARAELFSNYDLYYGHYRRYDRSSVRELCDAAGLRLQQQRYFFHALYAPAVLMSKLGIPRDIEARAPASAMRFLHRSLGILLAGESRVVPSTWPGTSIICTLEIPDRGGG
jgi:hypothetical protein